METATKADRAEANKAFVREYLEVISGEVKTEAAMRAFTTDEALLEHVRAAEAGFPRYEVLVDDLIAEGDKVVVRGRMRGKHEGEFAGIAPTGRQVEVPAIIFYRLEGDKIAEFWIQADMVGLMQQLTAEQ